MNRQDAKNAKARRNFSLLAPLASWRFALLLLVASLPSAGCGAPVAAPPAAPEQSAPSVDVARYFPLVDGHLYQYVTRTDEGEQGIVIARAVRPDKAHGELWIGREVKRLEYTKEGVVIAGDPTMFVLKAPLVPGTSWRGEHGGRARVAATGVAVTVPAGSYAGCIEVVEDRAGDRPLRLVTTFCPDVGITVLEKTTSSSSERAELRTVGPPVTIGPDGLIRVP